MNELVLDYNLFDLPTAQHKAGLAGLLIMIESMKCRGLDPLPKILELSANRAAISFTKESLQAVFDDLFDTELIEISVKNKWQGKKPKRIDEIIVVREGKEKKEKRFVYDVLQPKGLFLRTFYPDADGGWLQIWRSMLWNVLRAQPATRNVYEERANGHPSALAEKAYKLLVKTEKNRGQGIQISESFAGSVFIGAQDKNAEMVSFKGNPIDNLLLHFWHIASLVFIPRSFSIERSKEKATGIKWHDYGFALVIPEPSHIEYFFDDALDLLQRLDTASAGSRPRAALIDLAEESGLEYLYHLAKYRTQHQGVKDTVDAVEIYHIQKKGNNVRMLSAERLLPNINILSKYERIRATRMNPVFKTLYLKNILHGNMWYDNSQHILTTYSSELLIFKTGKTPVNFPFFGQDVKRKFSNIKKELEQMDGGEKMTDEGRDHLLARRIYDLVRHYARIKAENKSGQNFDDFKKDENDRILYPKEYREAVEKVCMDAFLAMRGRREQDFVEYFTGTICSVPQFLPLEDYLLVSQSLLDDWERVKSLAMLSISANSYISQPKKAKGERL